MKIVTYNLRCCYLGDGINSFVYRMGMIHDKITAEQPDVIAFQEVVDKCLEMLEKLLPDYLFVGQYRGPDYDGEGLYTAINKKTCQLLGLETIWLSPTPYVPGSRYENQSGCPRICVETLVRHSATGQLLRLFNLHLDHISEEARVCGMQCTLDFVKQFEGRGEIPVAILGDFNARPDSEAIALCGAFPGVREVTGTVECSFHNFGKRGAKIDYIFLSDALADQVKSVAAWEDVQDGIYLSDHYPICAEL